MNNAAIVRYTLSRLPEKQIDMYYSRTSAAHQNAKLDEKLDELTRIVTGLTFQTVMDNRKGIIFDPKNKPEEVERLKAQIGLYLTIAYVAIKQLVKINSRYYIAYQILERDTELLNKKVKDLGDATAISKHYIPFGNKPNRFFGPINYFLEQEDDINRKIGEGKTDDKKAWYAHLNKLKKQRLISPTWQERFKNEINESLAVSSTGFLPVLVRNMTEHLNVLALVQDYVERFRKDNSKMTSYFELYHFLMQSMLFQIKELNLEMFRKDVESGIADGRLVHVAYVPLGYNLARYKNLTIDALFDEDGVNGQNFLAQKCYKEAFNRIATAKRLGKSNEAIESLKKEFIEQYDSEEEANNAARLGEVWSYEDEARQSGLKGEPFPEMVLRMMKFKKFTDEEIAQVQHAYDAAKRKSEN